MGQQNPQFLSHETVIAKIPVSQKVKSANHTSREYRCMTLRKAFLTLQRVFEERKIHKGYM